MAKSGRERRATGGVYDSENDKLNAVGIGLNSHTLLVIKLPDSRALRIISRSMLLAIILLTLPSIASIIGGGTFPNSGLGFPDSPRMLSIILRDLVDEGLIKKGHRGFLLIPGLTAIEGDLKFLKDAGIDFHTGADPMRDDVRLRQAFDFVFLQRFNGIQTIDEITKDGSLVVAPLGPDSSDRLRLPRDFKIVYMRRFKSLVVALRKIKSNSMPYPRSKHVFCGVTPEKKEEALKGLEDVYLEPPRKAKTKSHHTSRKIKFLPDLLKDSLDKYPRRVFVSDDLRALDWFYKNYPMRDQEFEVYQMAVEKERGDGVREMGNDWLRRNVGPGDYVVMKGEAALVEEMLREKSLCLVDELFLECKNEWEDGVRGREKSKRAYWQCLDLYGRVRDEGIAVHQWWY